MHICKISSVIEKVFYNGFSHSDTWEVYYVFYLRMLI